MAVIEVTEKLVGSWYLKLTEDSDWLCGLTEIEPDKLYEAKYRFRYYKDDQAFDSKDEKSIYRGTMPGTRSYAIAMMRYIALEMEKRAIGKVDELLMENGDVDAFTKKLFNKPWAFVRIEKP